MAKRLSIPTPLGALLPELERLKRSGRKIVFTNGCFDVLHAGHVHYLRQAKALGDILVVGINSDISVRRLKGAGRPVNAAKDRAEVLAALKSVDFVTVFSEETPLKLIRALRPDFLVKGGDWKPADIVGGSFVQTYGGRVSSLAFVKGRSTSRLLNAIRRLG